MAYILQTYQNDAFTDVTARAQYNDLLEQAVVLSRRVQGQVYRIVRDGTVLMYYIDGTAMTPDEVIARLLAGQPPAEPVEPPAPESMPVAGPTEAPAPGPSERKPKKGSSS